MDARAENPDREIDRLRQCVGDLVGILALSSGWSGGDATDILNALLEALVRMLRLDFGYATVSDPEFGPRLECARFGGGLPAPPSTRELGSALDGLLGATNREPPRTMADPARRGALSLGTARLGLTQDAGWLVAASRRADFPTETEQLLLTVAAARAAIGLQEAKHLGRQRRIARTLDEKVAERTRQLETAAKELASERDRLRLLLGISEALVAHQDLASLFRSLAGNLRRVVECDFIGLALPEAGGRLRQHLVDYAGGRGAIEEGMVFPMEGSASGKAFRTQRLVCLEQQEDGRPDPEIYATPEGERFYRLLLQEGVPSGYFLPLIHGGSPIAVMQLTKYRGAPLKTQSVEFLNAVANQIAVAVANALEHHAVLESRNQLAQERSYLREEVDRHSMFEEIVGNSSALTAVLAHISRVAPTELTVLITGETGTGKELVARAIHKRSTRSSNAFVSVNCAAIPPSLIASELFGHEKGAFTGALQRRVGRFELAQGGTIFLDEIGELPPETQVALLRVLQEREFERVGGSQRIHTDARIIAATNRDLASAVAEGAFRTDLFYRLNVYPIEVPPLRVRREDIPLLAEYFMHRFANKLGKKVTTIGGRSMGLLMTYGWPGNIRELQNIIERSVIVCETEALSVDESWLVTEANESLAPREPLSRRLADNAKAQIEEALAEARGRVAGHNGAAARLGVPPSTLESKIRRLGIDKYRFRLL